MKEGLPSGLGGLSMSRRGLPGARTGQVCPGTVVVAEFPAHMYTFTLYLCTVVYVSKENLTHNKNKTLCFVLFFFSNLEVVHLFDLGQPIS